jgi:tetratricopeptide (TPR) repeat protein
VSGSTARSYEKRAACYAALGDKAREAADRVAADKYLPRSAQGLNERAWRLLTGPPTSRDPQRALELIQKAVKVEPDEAMYLNTLGVALYRNDRFTEAVATLEKSLAGGKVSRLGPSARGWPTPTPLSPDSRATWRQTTGSSAPSRIRPATLPLRWCHSSGR